MRSQAYDRAQTLLKTAAGTQKTLRMPRPRCAPRRRGSIRRRRGWRAARCSARSTGTGAADLLPRRRDGAGRPAGASRCCRRATSRCASSCREAMLPKSRSAIGRRPLRRLRCRHDRAGELHLAHAEFTPPVIYSLEERAKLVFLIEARTGAARATCASASRSSVRSLEQPERDNARDAADIAIDVHGLTKSFDGRAVVRDLSMQVKRGDDLRLPRAERLGQDHDHPHAVRAAHARRGRRHLPRLRHPHRDRRDQAPRRLHDAALQPLSGPLGAREPRVRRARLRHRRIRSRRRAR